MWRQTDRQKRHLVNYSQRWLRQERRKGKADWLSDSQIWLGGGGGRFWVTILDTSSKMAFVLLLLSVTIFFFFFLYYLIFSILLQWHWWSLQVDWTYEFYLPIQVTVSWLTSVPFSSRFLSPNRHFLQSSLWEDLLSFYTRCSWDGFDQLISARVQHSVKPTILKIRSHPHRPSKQRRQVTHAQFWGKLKPGDAETTTIAITTKDNEKRWKTVANKKQILL